MQGRKNFEPEVRDFEKAVQQPDGNGQDPIVIGNRTDERDKATKRRAVIAPREAALTQKSDEKTPEDSAKNPNKQQKDGILHEASPQEHTMLAGGLSDLNPNDPITSRSTLEYVEDLLTPLQTTSIEISYNTMAAALRYTAAPQNFDDPSSTVSPGLQDVFDEWLVSEVPDQ